MSLFITKLPVDLEALKRLLPKAQTHIEGVSWNPETKQVELKWSNPNLLTKFTVATEFPMEDLQKQILPKAVWMRERKVEPLTPAEAVDVATAILSGQKSDRKKPPLEPPTATASNVREPKPIVPPKLRAKNKAAKPLDSSLQKSEKAT